MNETFRSRRGSIVFATLACALLAYELYGFASVHSLFGDFRAFWCAGSAILNHADPYKSTALAACESRTMPAGLYTAPSGLVVPAPLPPYALLLFAPLARLPLPVASWLWFGLLLAAVCAACALLMQTLRTPAILIAAMVLLSACVLWLPYGEATPIAFLGAALAAWALQRRQYWPAAAGLLLLAVEPHLALGVWICIALFVPAMRVPIVAAGLALLALSCVWRTDALIEYVTAVLPMHAFAEISRTTQFSATWIAFEAGAQPQNALRAGEATFAVMLLLSIGVARALAQRYRDLAPFVLVPIAFAVCGGTFVHASDIVFAVPLAAYLAMRERGPVANVCAVACAFLAVPWLQGQQQTIVLLGVAIAGVIAYACTQSAAMSLRVLAGAALLAALLVVGAPERPSQAPATSIVHAGSSEELASENWGRYIWAQQSAPPSLHTWIAKIPTWLMLLTLICSSGYVARAAPQ